MGARSDDTNPPRTPSRGRDDARLPFGGKRRLYDVIKVRMPGSTRTVECDASEVYVEGGAQVVVKTRRGTLLARTVGTRYRKVLPTDTLQPILRAATERDLAREAENQQLAREALFEAVAEARAQRLDMKFITAELMLDRRRLILYFSAEGRVDFRHLVRGLSRKLRSRIEMHQVGVRNGAGMLGGIGSCGRELCCSTFLNDFEPVAIRMVKDQGLTLNPRKVSGMCGRLMCCLVYEHSGYVRGRKRLPRRRALVRTRHGLGRVRNIDIVQETVQVRHEDGTDETWPLIEVMLDPAEDAADGPAEPLVFTIDGLVPTDDAPKPPSLDASGPGRERATGRKRRRRDEAAPPRERRREDPGARHPRRPIEAPGAPDTSARDAAPTDASAPDDGKRRRRRRRRPGGGEGDPAAPPASAPAASASGESAPPREARAPRQQGAAPEGAAPASESGEGGQRRRRRRRRGGGGGGRDGGGDSGGGGGGADA